MVIRYKSNYYSCKRHYFKEINVSNASIPINKSSENLLAIHHIKTEKAVVGGKFCIDNPNFKNPWGEASFGGTNGISVEANHTINLTDPLFIDAGNVAQLIPKDTAAKTIKISIVEYQKMDFGYAEALVEENPDSLEWTDEIDGQNLFQYQGSVVMEIALTDNTKQVLTTPSEYHGTIVRSYSVGKLTPYQNNDPLLSVVIETTPTGLNGKESWEQILDLNDVAIYGNPEDFFKAKIGGSIKQGGVYAPAYVNGGQSLYMREKHSLYPEMLSQGSQISIQGLGSATTFDLSVLLEVAFYRRVN